MKEVSSKCFCCKGKGLKSERDVCERCFGSGKVSPWRSWSDVMSDESVVKLDHLVEDVSARDVRVVVY